MTVAEFVTDLGERLDRAAVVKTKRWWERYLKGEAEFRGVKMADIRRIVADLVEHHELDVGDDASVVDHAGACFARPWTEDKLAGVLLLAEHGLSSLSINNIEDLASPLATGQLADWNSVDWYCVKVLGPFLVAGSDLEARCRAVADWVHAETLWQRRAGVVAFVNHAATEPELFDGFTELLFEIAEVNVGDEARWSQTSVGWLLRELARRRPDLVSSFVAAHPDMSSEAKANALKHL